MRFTRGAVRPAGDHGDDRIQARVEWHRRRVDHQVANGGISEVASVQVADIGSAGPVGLVELVPGRCLVDALLERGPLGPGCGRTVQADVQGIGTGGKDRGAGTARDDPAGPRGQLSEHLLGSLAEGVLVGGGAGLHPADPERHRRAADGRRRSPPRIARRSLELELSMQPSSLRCPVLLMTEHN